MLADALALLPCVLVVVKIEGQMLSVEGTQSRAQRPCPKSGL